MGGRLDLYTELLKVPYLPTDNSRIVEHPEELPPLVLTANAKQITVANQRQETKAILEPYNLSNYRRKRVAVILTPDLRVEIDSLIFDTRGLLECTVTL